jgi:hypothetical protein
VDDSVTAGVGRRLDGWANRDLNVGAIIASAPNLDPIAQLTGHTVEALRAALNNWGVGKFDAQFLLDGIAERPGGGSAATLIPPAYGMAGVNEHTWTAGWGTTTYWNAFVANIEMQGQGRFYDPRLANAALMAKIHTTEWTPALMDSSIGRFVMRSNWWGIAGEHFARGYGRLGTNDVISGIMGSPPAHHGAPYSMTEEFVACYRMHSLMPDEFSFRRPSDDVELLRTDMAGASHDVWEVNTDFEYHEEQRLEPAANAQASRAAGAA